VRRLGGGVADSLEGCVAASVLRACTWRGVGGAQRQRHHAEGSKGSGAASEERNSGARQT
jgi:hypothetical protein